jgi:hypothetical protein
MTKHLLWSASCAWLALMGIVWALFVPKGLSVGTFTLFSAAGPLSLLAAARAWRAERPSRSLR